jgi:hypothetical protein
MFVYVLKLLPLLFIKVEETVKTFDGFKRCFVHRITSSYNVEIPTVKNSNGVVMSWLFQITNFCPLIFRYIINFALFTGLIRVLATDGIDKIFGFKFKFSMKMGQLVATSGIIHKSSFFDTISLFIDNITLIGKYWSNVIFFFFSTDKENFILSLNRSKFLRKNICISYRNFNGSLGVQLVDKKTFLLFIVIMQPRLYTGQNIIGLKTNHIMKKSSEFIYFGFYFDDRSRIFLNKIDMIPNFRFEFCIFTFKFLNEMFLLKDFQILFALIVIL